MTYRLCAPCHFGLEKTLSFEIKRAGGQDIKASDGRVFFTGDENVIAQANMTCSVAERVGIVLAQFAAKTFDDVFYEVQKIPIEQFAAKNDNIHIKKGNSLNSALTSIPALQRTLKSAFVKRMQKSYGIERLPQTGAVLPVHFLLMKDQMTVTLDTSGEGLHKRGYRAMSNAAPIRETLAAGIADLARIRETDILADPFCGSGTILIEAALKAAGIAPCMNRKFAAMSFGFIDGAVWSRAYEKAKADIRKDCSFTAYGYDCDPSAVALTKDNAQKAGVQSFIKASVRDIRDFHYICDGMKIVTNPPYAQRMGTAAQTHELYRTMGRVLLPRGTSQLYIITSDEQFEELFGETADKNRKLYNGMLMCRLYTFR